MRYIIALFGMSGCGKDTVKKMIEDKYPEIKPINRITTRPMREGESQYNPYIFVNNQTLRKMALQDTENFMEVEEIKDRDWFYATHRAESFFNESPIDTYIGCYSLEATDALVDYSEMDEDFYLIPIKIEVRDKVRLIRQLTREEDPDCDEIVRRYTTDSVDYRKTVQFPHFVVENSGDINECLETIYEIIEGEILDVVNKKGLDK